MPQLSGTQGFKLTIDIEDWDKAVEIEKTAASPEATVKTSVESGNEQGTVGLP